MPAATEVLDLSTIVEKRTIRIRTLAHPDGKLYELLNVDDLGVYDLELLGRHEKLLSELAAVKKPTPAQERALDRALDEMIKLAVPDLEPRVLRELSQSKKAMILKSWAPAQEGGDPGNAASAPTGGARSRDSKPSTAATPRRGSGSRTGSSRRS